MAPPSAARFSTGRRKLRGAANTCHRRRPCLRPGPDACPRCFVGAATAWVGGLGQARPGPDTCTARAGRMCALLGGRCYGHPKCPPSCAAVQCDLVR